jgi:hypothetical protein
MQPLPKLVAKEVAMDFHTRRDSTFPANWKDPMDLFGNLAQDLISAGHDLESERNNVREMVGKYGAQWVWDNRIRLVSMVRSLKESAWEVG